MELNINYKGECCTLAITREKEKENKGFNNSLIYTCVTFNSNDLISFRNFTIIYDMIDRKYWSWTANSISQTEIDFRNEISNLLNVGKLKLAI
ncbi:hypothetical protein [Bacillus wiedmannii]|uniref:hypothetical protein n=1 Tax=Bacillus wiedmannii TaxID=1890302 RepID=UPI003D25EF70